METTRKLGGATRIKMRLLLIIVFCIVCLSAHGDSVWQTKFMDVTSERTEIKEGVIVEVIGSGRADTLKMRITLRGEAAAKYRPGGCLVQDGNYGIYKEQPKFRPFELNLNIPLAFEPHDTDSDVLTSTFSYPIKAKQTLRVVFRFIDPLGDPATWKDRKSGWEEAKKKGIYRDSLHFGESILSIFIRFDAYAHGDQKKGNPLRP